jgi:esterase/lipase
MNTNIESSTPSGLERHPRRSKPSVPIFLIIWILLIAAGVLGTIWYTGKIKEQLTLEVSKQTAQQITAMQTDYEAQIKQLQANFTSEIVKVQGKVDALNELLEFSKDNANSKTDNSNKLFSQLSEVKKQLNELQKSLDVLK